MNKCVHRNKILTDLAHRADHDPLILHISESWLDSFMDKKSIVGKINLEIETFLKPKQNNRSTENLVTRDCRDSLESVPLNDAMSAPRDVEGDDSVGSDSNCFELNKLSYRGSKVHEEEPVDIEN